MNQKRNSKNNSEPSIEALAGGVKNARKTSAQLDSEGAIGSGLRSLYQELVKEPLPDDILALLDKLESMDFGDE